MKRSQIDKPFVASVFILVAFGFFIFSSASLGLLTRDGPNYTNVIWSQIIYGLVIGTFGFIVATRIPYTFYRKHAFLIFVLAIIAGLLVFVPGLGFAHGGARRWIEIGPFTVQPSEFLKLGFVIYFAAWAASVKDKIATWKYGFWPFLIILAIVGGVILAEPDTDTFAIICIAGLAMFIVGGSKWRHILSVMFMGAVFIILLALMRPYVMQRILTYLNPSQDIHGAGYQIRQSLIAVGSGGFFGRGFGQSIQKFDFLPEPISDSVFAVAAEEFGFAGSVVLIGLFLFFASRALKIATRSPDIFSRLMTVGIAILILSQSFINIAAMLNIAPLSGNVLVFVSHGSTSLIATLFATGIVANISRYQSR